MSSKPRAKRTDGTLNKQEAKSTVKAVAKPKQKDKKSNELISLKEFHPEGLWNGLLRPLGAAMVAADVLFLNTVLQGHKDTAIPAWEPSSIALLCVGVLMLGFWYVLNALFRVAQSGHISERMYDVLSTCWLIGIWISIVGIGDAIGIAYPWIGVGFIFAVVLLAIILGFVVAHVADPIPDDETSRGVRSKAKGKN